MLVFWDMFNKADYLKYVENTKIYFNIYTLASRDNILINISDKTTEENKKYIYIYNKNDTKY